MQTKIITKDRILKFVPQRISFRSVLLFGTTPHLSCEIDSLFTVLVPKVFGDTYQYNTIFEKLPDRITEKEELHFNFTVVLSRSRKVCVSGEKLQTYTFDFPAGERYILFLKTKFIAFHLEQSIAFKFLRESCKGRLKFEVNKPEPLEIIDSRILEVENQQSQYLLNEERKRQPLFPEANYCD